MAETNKEYLVGWISPTNRPEGRENQLDAKMPPNIRLLNVSVNFTRGTEEEFRASMPTYEAKVRELAAMKANLILPSGAPPFMLLGFVGERQIIDRWEKQFGVPMFTSGQNHVRALKTLSIKDFVGASYFPEKMNSIFRRYFTEAGFNVLAMEGMDVAFNDVPKLSADQIFDHIKSSLERHPGAQGIYMLGSAWRTLNLIDRLEEGFGIPVVHPGPARWWETLIRLRIHHPVSGYGKLLATMPEARSLV
jgi:maleate isomerase